MGSIAVRGSVQDTLQSLTYAKLNYSQLIQTIWRKGKKKKGNEEEEGNQRLLVNETAPTKLLLGNQADAVIRWKFLEYFLVYKICN